MRDVATNSFSITTKDFDFGEPGRMKKIYSVIITYKSDNAQTQPIYYAVDGSDSFSSQLTGNFTANTSWAVLRATEQVYARVAGNNVRLYIRLGAKLYYTDFLPVEEVQNNTWEGLS